MLVFSELVSKVAEKMLLDSLKAGIAMKDKVLPHKTIVKKIIRDIYEEKLKPGEKLPPLREFSKELGADLTSLRIALKHLEFMRVLEIKRSDGVYILDYRKEAGPEFLMALFPEEGDETSAVDGYLIDEIFEYWVVLLPELIKTAWKRYSHRNIKEMRNIYEEELLSMNDIPALVKMEMRLIDILTEAAGNIMMTLTMNAIRPMQEKMIEFFIKGIGQEEFKNYITLRKEMIGGFLTANDSGIESGINAYRKTMERYRQLMRSSMAENLK